MGAVYMGIDPANGRIPYAYAVMDADLRVKACALGDLAALGAALAEHDPEIVAVDGPLRALPAPGQPAAGRLAGQRAAELELRRRGLRVPLLPFEGGGAPRWMQAGFAAHAALREQGYHVFQAGAAARRQTLEANPYAAFAALLEHLPYARTTLEGRLQRQTALYREGLDLADPMEIVEEITRFHLLAGTLTLPGLRSAGELDALACAYTACLAATQPANMTLVGEPAEGQVAVPVPPAELRELYE